MTIRRILKEDLRERLGDPSVEVLDVRLNYDGAVSRIRGAEGRNPDKIGDWYTEFDPEKTLVLYCSSPGEKTSTRAADFLQRKGFKNVLVLDAGWKVWTDSGFPTEEKKKSPLPGQVVPKIRE